MKETLALGLLFLPLALWGQIYENTPFYKISGPPVADETAYHNDLKTNGVSALFTMPIPPGLGYGPGARDFSIALDVTGKEGHQVAHMWLWDTQRHYVFGYDLVLERVPGAGKVKCIFRSVTNPHKIRLSGLDQTVLVPLSGPFKPLVVADGDTISVSMLPGADPSSKFIQYIQISTTKR